MVKIKKNYFDHVAGGCSSGCRIGRPVIERELV